MMSILETVSSLISDVDNENCTYASFLLAPLPGRRLRKSEKAVHMGTSKSILTSTPARGTVGRSGIKLEKKYIGICPSLRQGRRRETVQVLGKGEGKFSVKIEIWFDASITLTLS